MRVLACKQPRSQQTKIDTKGTGTGTGTGTETQIDSAEQVQYTYPHTNTHTHITCVPPTVIPADAAADSPALSPPAIT